MKNHYVPSQSFANHQVVKTRNNDKLTVETNTTNILSKSHETGNFSARASCPNDKCRHESRNIKSTGCSTHRLSASASSSYHPGRSNNISYVYVIFILWYIIWFNFFPVYVAKFNLQGLLPGFCCGIYITHLNNYIIFHTSCW